MVYLITILFIYLFIHNDCLFILDWIHKSKGKLPLFKFQGGMGLATQFWVPTRALQDSPVTFGLKLPLPVLIPVA
jgi:hypothetical protein